MSLEDAPLRRNDTSCPDISLQLWVTYFVSGKESGSLLRFHPITGLENKSKVFPKRIANVLQEKDTSVTLQIGMLLSILRVNCQ